jgi:hypothetical protein
MVGAKDFSLLQNIQTGSEAHPAFCSVSSFPGTKLLGHEVYCFFVYAFVAWTRKTYGLHSQRTVVSLLAKVSNSSLLQMTPECQELFPGSTTSGI